MVSVIVPNYNHARFLDERFMSILNQTYQDFELIILDDCSTDNSKDFINKYVTDPRVSHVVYNEVNTGSPFKQWNKGIELAKGEWIWIAESDDVADIFFLEVLINIAESEKSLGLIYSQLRSIDENNKIVYDGLTIPDSLYSGDDFLKRKLLYSTTIFNVSSCIFRKSVYSRIDNTKYQSFKYGGDYMLYVQLSRFCDIYECGQCLCSYRFVNTSVSHEPTSITAVKEGVRILDYITSKVRVPQYIYIIYYVRALYRNNLSCKKKIYANIIYIIHGYLLFPIMYLIYCLKKFF